MFTDTIRVSYPDEAVIGLITDTVVAKKLYAYADADGDITDVPTNLELAASGNISIQPAGQESAIVFSHTDSNIDLTGSRDVRLTTSEWQDKVFIKGLQFDETLEKDAMSLRYSGVLELDAPLINTIAVQANTVSTGALATPVVSVWGSNVSFELFVDDDKDELILRKYDETTRFGGVVARFGRGTLTSPDSIDGKVFDMPPGVQSIEGGSGRGLPSAGLSDHSLISSQIGDLDDKYTELKSLTNSLLERLATLDTQVLAMSSNVSELASGMDSNVATITDLQVLSGSVGGISDALSNLDTVVMTVSQNVTDADARIAYLESNSSNATEVVAMMDDIVSMSNQLGQVFNVVTDETTLTLGPVTLSEEDNQFVVKLNGKELASFFDDGT